MSQKFFAGRIGAKSRSIRCITLSVSNPDQFDSVTEMCRNFDFWAYIYHDKDVNDGEPVPRHLHAVVINNAGTTLNRYSELFNIPANMIEIVYCKPKMIRYLCHLDNPEKHKYPIKDIVTSDKQKLDNFINQGKGGNASDEWTLYKKLVQGKISVDEYIHENAYQFANLNFYQKIQIFSKLSDFIGGNYDRSTKRKDY